MKRSLKQLLLITTLLAAQGAWAQSDTDLPALPPGMESAPAAELPPPPAALPPALPAAEQLPPPISPAIDETSPAAAVETLPPAVTEAPVQPAAPVATEVFEPAPAPTNTVAAAQPENMPAGMSPTVPEGTQIKEDFKPSYGEFGQSLLFSADDIDRMKKVLYMYERVKRPDTGVAQPVQDEFAKLIEAPVKVAVEEPKEYPSFYLSSIVYRSPRDWLFWMNGTKYSPKTMPGYMEMVSISSRAVTLMWKPEYISAAQMRYEQKIFDNSMPKHFRSRMSQVRWDKEKEAFLITLSPNQSFVSAAFGVFEGKYADRAVPEMAQEAQVQEMLADTPAAPQEFKDPDAALKATMQGLQQTNSNIGQFAPRNNPNANDPDAQPPASSGAAGTNDMMTPSMPTIERAL